MKRAILPAILLFPVVTLLCWVYWGSHHLHTMIPPGAQRTISDRMHEYGPDARARLKPYFDAKKVSYPPAWITLVGLKNEKTLEVYAGQDARSLQFIRSYSVLAASGVAGPKLREGDLQVPEGIYGVESLNPNSKYHLSLRVNYPNAFDRDRATEEKRTNLGGDIMIHGGSSSVGCLAVGDAASEELFVLAADSGITNITIILSPFNFRKVKNVKPADTLPAWTEILYQTIQANLAALPPE